MILAAGNAREFGPNTQAQQFQDADAAKILILTDFSDTQIGLLGLFFVFCFGQDDLIFIEV